MTDPPTRAEGAWKIVPVEPLPEMIGAWYRQKNTGSQEPGVEGADRSDYAAYRAMLAASPAAPDIAELAEENARLRKALEDEREACAKVATDMRDIYNEDDHNHMANACNGVATAILARAALSPQEGRG